MIERLDRESDESQHASNIEQAERDIALSAIRERAAEKPPAGFDKQHCMECGGKIPDGRLALGKWTCVYCQNDLDEMEKRKARK